MTSKPSNGTMPAPRNPFARQGSSVGGMGGVHPMAVVQLGPTHAVDYSVTKGGARTWTVLIVFLILCSSLYTVFSSNSPQSARAYNDINDDIDDDVVENIVERKHRDSIVEPERRQERRPPPELEETELDSDDVEDEEDELETKLFSSLREKIEKNLKKRRNKKTVKEEDDEEEEEVVQPKQLKRLSRRKQRQQKREEEEDEDDEEVVVQPIKDRRRQKKERVKSSRKHRVIDADEDSEDDEDEDADVDKDEDNNADPAHDDDNNDEDDDDDDDDDEDDDKDDDDDDDNKPSENNKEERELDSQDNDKEEKHDEKEDESDDENEADVPQRKRRKAKFIRISEPVRKCRRKHCPMADTGAPRKNLLKQKAHKSTGKKYTPLSLDDFDFDDDSDDDDDDDIEPVIELPTPIIEVAAVKKHKSERESYKRRAITNKEDHAQRNALDSADFLVEKHDFASAIDAFDSVLNRMPDSPRGHFGKARAYQIRGEERSAEKDLDKAMHHYEDVIDNEDSPDALFKQACARMIHISRFRGHLHKTINTHRALIDRFPEDLSLQVDFAITFLMMKRYDDANKVLQNILEIDPNNAEAMTYRGYILKISTGEIETGVSLMRKGLRLAQNINDPKIFFHLGHGLVQLGRNSEAQSVYETAAEKGIFPSALQRSTHNVEGLAARPWWSLDQTTHGKQLKHLERQWISIKYEAEQLLEMGSDLWVDEEQSFLMTGFWQSYPLTVEGVMDKEACELVPNTCRMIRQFIKDTNATRPEVKLSLLSSGARVMPHCGSTNTRIEAHLGLVTPSQARIRVGNERRGWKAGKFVVFDDSFEHELEFDGASAAAYRLVLVIPLWHPEVDERYRTSVDY